MDNDYLSVIGNHDQFLLKCALMRGRLDGHVYDKDEEIQVWNEQMNVDR